MHYHIHVRDAFEESKHARGAGGKFTTSEVRQIHPQTGQQGPLLHHNVQYNGEHIGTIQTNYHRTGSGGIVKTSGRLAGGGSGITTGKGKLKASYSGHHVPSNKHYSEPSRKEALERMKNIHLEHLK